MTACSAEVGDVFWADTSFSQGVLPLRAGGASANPPSFLDYLLQPLLWRRRPHAEGCRSSWAFALTGAVQCATALAYQRLGRLFDSRFMSATFLISCYEQGPRGICGCRGADLPVLLSAVAGHGLVTFRQFPYVATRTINAPLDALVEEAYYCERDTHLGTCPPCNAALDDYSETAIAASPDLGSFRFVVPCIPCSQPTAPLYFPSEPFHVAVGLSAPLKQQVEAVKAELRRVGPLCAAIGIDAEAFTALQSAGRAPTVAKPGDGIFYRPRHVLEDLYRSVLIVGYVDAGAEDAAFWICWTAIGSVDVGYTLAGQGIEGLFNVDMYSQDSRLLQRVLSFERILVRVTPDGAPQPPGVTDPMVSALAPLARALSLSASAEATVPQLPSIWAELPTWVWVALLLLATALALIAVARWQHSSP